MTRSARTASRLALSLLLLTAFFSAAARPALADVVKTFTLSNVTFSDGSTAEGTFTYDFTTQALVKVRITSGNAVYDNSAAAPVSISASDFYGAFDSSTESDTFQFSLNVPLTPTSGSTITLDPSLSTETVDTTPGGDSGTVTTLAVASGSVLPSASLPRTTATFAGTAGKAGWYTTAVTVTLTATAGAAPVASTAYTLDGGAPQPYTGPFVVSVEAAHSLTFRSTDTAGNVEAIETAAVNVDGTPPLTNAHTNGGPALTYAATDNASGVASTYYTVDGGAVKTASKGTIRASGYGPHTVQAWSVDVAGNVEPPSTFSLDVPPSAPGEPYVTAQSLSAVTFKWTAPHDTVPIAGYSLLRYVPGHSGRGGGPSRWVIVGTTTTNSITYTSTFTNSVSFAVEAFDSTGYPSAQSTTRVIRGYSAPFVYPFYAGQYSKGPDAILGGGFGVLTGGLTGFSPYGVTTLGYPAPILKVVGGPKGMTINSTTGVVSWTPAGAPGTYTATITATSAAGTASLPFTYVVYAAGTDLFSPTAPGAPTFTNVTHIGATVSWTAATDNVGVAGYVVYVYNASMPAPQALPSPGPALSMDVTTLPPGSSVDLWVIAYDAGGNQSLESPGETLTLTP